MKQHDASRRSFLKATAVAGAAAATGGPVWAQAAGDKSLVTLRMSSTLPLDPNSAHFVWYDRFSKNLQAAVGNKVVVNYFPSDQLGKEADVVQQVKIGGVDMMISGSSIWATLVPEIGVLDMGYLFTDNDHCGRALDGKAGAILNKMVDERINVQVLGWCYSLGARNVWTKNPVKTASDLKGVKLRVLPVPNFIATLRYMGAVPTPLPFGEIYTALQTGVVDGFEHDAATVPPVRACACSALIARSASGCARRLVTARRLSMPRPGTTHVEPSARTAFGKGLASICRPCRSGTVLAVE